MTALICHTLPPCARPGCGQPACDHADPSPHVYHARGIWCDGYQPEEGMPLEGSPYVPGGGSSGGGGASGGW